MIHLVPLLFISVPTPVVSVVEHPIPYNGTVFTLSGVAQLDQSVDTNVTAVGIWSDSDGPQVVASPPYQIDLVFQPLATDSSREYTLNVTIRATDDSPFIESNRGITIYNLTVQRKFCWNH